MQNSNRVRIEIRQKCSKETHEYYGTTRVRRNKRNEEYTLISLPNPTSTVNMVNWTTIEPLNHAPPVQPHNVSSRNLLREKNSSSSPLQSGTATSRRNFPRAVDELLQPGIATTQWMNYSNQESLQCSGWITPTRNSYNAVDELLQPGIATTQWMNYSSLWSPVPTAPAPAK